MQSAGMPPPTVGEGCCGVMLKDQALAMVPCSEPKLCRIAKPAYLRLGRLVQYDHLGVWQPGR